jgi:hypothetical protein
MHIYDNVYNHDCYGNVFYDDVCYDYGDNYIWYDGFD